MVEVEFDFVVTVEIVEKFSEMFSLELEVFRREIIQNTSSADDLPLKSYESVENM